MTKFYCNTVAFFSTYKKDESGVTAIEYGLIAIAMATLLTVVFFGSQEGSIITELNNGFATIAGSLGTANTPAP